MASREAPRAYPTSLRAAAIGSAAYGLVAFLGVLYLNLFVLSSSWGLESVTFTAAVAGFFLAIAAAGAAILLGRPRAVTALMILSAPLPLLAVYGACATVMLDASGPHPWSMAAVAWLLLGVAVSTYSFVVTSRLRKLIREESEAA